MTQEFARGLARIVSDIDALRYDGQVPENSVAQTHLTIERVELVSILNAAGFKLTRAYKVVKSQAKP